MRLHIIRLIGSQFVTSIFKGRALYPLAGIMLLLLLFASISGYNYYQQNTYRIHHQEEARESWEANPDKHPHRMAHFGTFAFRVKNPLSIFEFGLESYVGNAVFLEAHKQNMVNFSEASFSTGLLRFGELSMATILQLLLPLIIFFLGYTTIVSERENGTLKIFLTQGASWKEILLGKSLGLFRVAMLFTLPFLLGLLFMLIVAGDDSPDVWLRFGLVVSVYICFIIAVCMTSVLVSARSTSSRQALVKLLGLWLLMVVLMPKAAQAVGSYIYSAPNKIAFKSAIEKEVIKTGDSHDPFDPYFAALRDSVLEVHQVDSVTHLPFNYGGFIMGEGEKLSAKIYNKHHDQLLAQYRKQNQLTRYLAFLNPYLAIKNVSMALSASDFNAYVAFQQQAEAYRYEMAQKMNYLQMEFISSSKVSGSEGKVFVIDRKEWKAFPDFTYQQISLVESLKQEWLSLLSIVFWIGFTTLMLFSYSKKANAI
ncbi:MAG: DUF3526 domain-containing protein [Bacteroidota bacterium]